MNRTIIPLINNTTGSESKDERTPAQKAEVAAPDRVLAKAQLIDAKERERRAHEKRVDRNSNYVVASRRLTRRSPSCG